MKNSKLEKLLEFYRPKPIHTSSRLMYPRNLSLSNEFVDAFRGEYKRLVAEGQNPKNLLTRVNKALLFHLGEQRKNKINEIKASAVTAPPTVKYKEITK